MKRVIFSADDFGLSPAVNEGIEQAHRNGLLQSASLMVAAPAAADAVARARRMPDLRVGLHLVVIEGPAVLGPAEIPDLLDAQSQFPSDQLGLGLRYFFRAAVRRQLEAEIAAQFQAFAATGLALDHANAHKHMHLHPTIGALMLRIGARFGLRAVRVPAEPPDVLTNCGTRTRPGDRLLYRWTDLLRHQVRRSGMVANDHCFGLAWSGQMTADRLLQLARHLPDGLSEVYFHPASGRDMLLDRLMPAYRHDLELQALQDPAVADAFRAAGAIRTSYGAISQRPR